MYRELRKVPCVYILASGYNGTLYIGVTSNLHDRISVHAKGLVDGFSRKYGVTRLVYYEFHLNMPAAIKRETQLKKWNRLWKIRLIEQMNPGWQDLFDGKTGAILPGPADKERAKAAATRPGEG